MAVFKRSHTDKKTGKVKQSQKYYGDVIDHNGIERRFPLFTTKSTSQEAERKIKKLVECRLSGVTPDRELLDFLEHCPFKDKLVQWGIITEVHCVLANPKGGPKVVDLVKDWSRTLSHNTPDYVVQTQDKMFRLAADCHWKMPRDISSESFLKWREERLNGKNTRSCTNVRTGKPAQRKNKLSPRTCDYYLVLASAFCTWLANGGRLDRNRLASVKPFGSKRGGKRERAIYTPEELEKLIAVATVGDKSYGLEGPGRAFLYLLAYQTGLRYSEAKSLEPESFDLVAESPTVTVQAKDTKNGKRAVLPLPLGLVPMVKQHLGGIKSGQPIFGGGQRKGKGAPMIHKDMKKAGIPRCDEKGNTRDFHSLRHTYCTLLARSGVPLIMAQKLMRHSDPKLTANFYTHLEIEDLAKEVAKLPGIKLSRSNDGKMNAMEASA